MSDFRPTSDENVSRLAEAHAILTADLAARVTITAPAALALAEAMVLADAAARSVTPRPLPRWLTGDKAASALFYADKGNPPAIGYPEDHDVRPASLHTEEHDPNASDIEHVAVVEPSALFTKALYIALGMECQGLMIYTLSVARRARPGLFSGPTWAATWKVNADEAADRDPADDAPRQRILWTGQLRPFARYEDAEAAYHRVTGAARFLRTIRSDDASDETCTGDSTHVTVLESNGLSLDALKALRSAFVAKADPAKVVTSGRRAAREAKDAARAELIAAMEAEILGTK